MGDDRYKEGEFVANRYARRSIVYAALTFLFNRETVVHTYNLIWGST